jgi:putative phage-type endonuclease
MQSRSKEWLEWRHQGLGSSDAPAILDMDPYCTRLERWKQKTGPVVESEPNFVQQRGIDLEPQARALYELHNDMEFPEAFMQHAQYPFLRCSLDGYCESANKVLEIKCPGKDSHERALVGEVPEHYMIQLDHQFLVSGAAEADYVSYYPDHEDPARRLAVVTVKPDQARMAVLLVAELEFWKMVQDRTPPPLGNRDFKELIDPTAVPTFTEWKETKLVVMQIEDQIKKVSATTDGDALAALKKHKKEIDGRLEALRERIGKLIDHPKVTCAGVRVVTQQRKTGPVIQVSLEGVGA